KPIMIIIAVSSGSDAGRRFELDQDVVRVGRAPGNDVVLSDPHVSGQHLRIIRGASRTVVEDLRSTRGTVLVTAQGRRALDEAHGLAAEIGDEAGAELGTGDEVTAMTIVIREDEHARVVSMRRIHEIASSQGIERDPSVLGKLYAVQKRVGGAGGLDEVLQAICDGTLQLLPRATHVTITLREDDEGAGEPMYVTVLTRVRGSDGGGRAPDGPVPIARSVFRKVLSERAAVLAADAPEEVAQVESIVGASIRSTVAVPLWRGDEILGVMQADNRQAPAMLNAADLELLALFASNASLAVSNARLIRRLQAVQEQLRKENDFLRTREQTRGHTHGIIGRSGAMTKLLDQLGKVVDTRVTVLVEGETGTGKELVASAVHYRSRRRDKLFVAQNCAALPENLLESELFGHKRGSFTGATEDKRGLFDIADGGTLFLDEVGEITLALQSKLLRVLQEGEIRPVGAPRPHHVDVRIVAATNKQLEDEMRAGRFREDLYYRLKVFPLRVPPLRERREDIPLLAGAFLKRYASELAKAVGGFGQQAMELLVAYDWPGNVRELQNEVQRLVIQLDEGGFVVPELLSERIRCVEGLVAKAGMVRGTLREMMDQVEKFLLIESLREHGNNKTNAAKSLGITREGLHKKLRAYKL
ncbi:MAG: sigma 54-interacting transcriptional regulator, partial [Polyangiaceae bacterium]|nr:sigma 54-interacting transcriptional regulator [Polyangiaceae bacterium]